jgi:hypothetical protein
MEYRVWSTYLVLCVTVFVWLSHKWLRVGLCIVQLQSSWYCSVIFLSVILLAVCIFIMNNTPFHFKPSVLNSLPIFSSLYDLLSGCLGDINVRNDEY